MPKKKEKISKRNPLEIIEDLEILKNTEGWRIVLEIIKGNVKVLDNMILEKNNVDGTELSDEDIDKLRYKRSYLLELKNTPENYIEKLKKEDLKPREYDPYFKTAKEIIADRKKRKK